MAMKKYWTQERIMQAFRDWERLHGSPPKSSTLWKKSRSEEPMHPTDRVVQREYGTWAAALEAYSRTKADRPHPDTNEIIALMQAWKDEHGIAPVASDWDKNINYPTPGFVASRFGSWNAAIVEAGFFPRTRGITKKALARYTPLPRRRREDHANQGSGEEASGDEGVA